MKVESSEAHKEFVTQVFKDGSILVLSSDKQNEHDEGYQKVKPVRKFITCCCFFSPAGLL